MKLAALRRADRWLGSALCFLLTLRRRAGGRDAGDTAPAPRRILFVKPAEQGSTVLAVPAIERAAALVGRENVFFLVFEENRFILDALGAVPPGNVITVRSGTLAAALSSSLAAVRRMRRLHIDAALDLEFFARSSAIYAFLSGATRRVGFHAAPGGAPYRGDLMTHRLTYNPALHTAQTFSLLVEALAHPASRFPAFDAAPPPLPADLPRFTPAAGETAAVRALLRDALGGDDLPPLVLLNANCSDILPLRRWPEERYVELARRLLARRPDAAVAFTGSPGEAAAADSLAAAVGSPRCISLAGRTTLRQLLALFGLAEVLVTNDSGPAHFAALTPVEIVTLFGPETPALYASPSPRSHVLWAGLACSPCVNAWNNRVSLCRDNVCMRKIGVGEVFDEVCRHLGRRRPAP
jgi:ADP-heptose:LPS heptosyltransferase